MLLEWPHMTINYQEILNTVLSLYLPNLLDLFIITLLIYSLFLFFRRTSSQFLFIGLAVTVVLYFLARSLQLNLTLVVLQYFFGVFIFAFIVIFQSEIRKYIEVLGIVSSRQLNVKPKNLRMILMEEIVHATVKMAQEKVGALIVLEGLQDVARFTQGGVSLDGVISEEILLSIFDTHSEGHDGAVIVSNGRITMFGAHLPLSLNFKEIGKHGTRHSAALGVVEQCDALAIVVSEEKGTISVCKEGKLKTLAKFSDLEREIDTFVKKRFFPKTENPWRRIFTHNFTLKAAAVCAALLLWFISNYM